MWQLALTFKKHFFPEQQLFLKGSNNLVGSMLCRGHVARRGHLTLGQISPLDSS
jgi:hypothetical protein